MSAESPLDRMVAELARKESAGLLEDAVAQAKRRVRDDLARRIADAMTTELASIVDTERTVAPSESASVVPTASSTASPTVSSTASPTASPTVPNTNTVSHPGPTAERGLYAYGIVRDGELDLRAATGIGSDEPAWVVTSDGLGLVVSDIPLAELAGLDNEQPAEDGRLAEFARGHDAVVRAVFDQGPILPLRFGTVLTDAAAATALLARQREALTTLDRIAGKREWGTKILHTPDTTAEPDGPGAGSAPSGTAYLTRKRDELVARKVAREHRRTTLDRVHGTLAALAADDVRRATVGESVLLDSAFLVPEDATDDFLARVEEVARGIAAEDLSLRATGPWPPYSFAVLEERTSA